MTSFLNSIPKKMKSSEQLIYSTKQQVVLLISNSWESEVDKTTTEHSLSKNMMEIKTVLIVDNDHPELIDEEKMREITRFIQSEGFFVIIIDKMEIMPFEVRKDAALIFNNLIRRNFMNFALYVLETESIIKGLVAGYGHTDSALNCGSMLRECTRHESLAKYILNSDLVWTFLDTHVHVPNFDVASDAFNTLKELLTTPKNKHVSSEFLETQYDRFLVKYETLLQSNNHVLMRRSLKLLAELLVDRSNYSIMMRYIASKSNLKTIMNLLKHKSAHIQFEAFHVFKIFVANPNKTREIAVILGQNKVRLVAFLESFHLDKEDPQFVDERRLLIETLKQLDDTRTSSSSGSSIHRSAERQSSQDHFSDRNSRENSTDDPSFFAAEELSGLLATASLTTTSSNSSSSGIAEK